MRKEKWLFTTLPNDFFTEHSTPSLEALNAAWKNFLSVDTNPVLSSLTNNTSPHHSKQIHHLNPRYSGPFKVLTFRDNNTVVISLDGKPQMINLDKGKPAHGFSDPYNQIDVTDSQLHRIPSTSHPCNTQSSRYKNNKKKSVFFTSFVRIWDPQHPKHIPFHCIRMKE